MKIVVRAYLLSGFLSCVVVGGVVEAYAETTVLDLAKKTTDQTVAAAAAPQPANTAQAAPADSASSALPVINAPAVTGAAPNTLVANATDSAGSETSIRLDNPDRTKSDKDVPEQVEKVIDKLRGAKVDLSLEDMNQARAALARLDLLLELEQKMHDLQKARQKNEASSDDSDISGLLPTQVTGMARRGGMPMASAAPIQPMPVVERAPPKPAPSSYEIQRISGVNGNYSATLKNITDQKISSVRSGDKLADDTEVLSVAPTGVRLREPGGKVRTLVIENASAMSGARGAH